MPSHQDKSRSLNRVSGEEEGDAAESRGLGDSLSAYANSELGERTTPVERQRKSRRLGKGTPACSLDRELRNREEVDRRGLDPKKWLADREVPDNLRDLGLWVQSLPKVDPLRISVSDPPKQ
jgi:hypothetical protein